MGTVAVQSQGAVTVVAEDAIPLLPEPLVETVSIAPQPAPFDASTTIDVVNSQELNLAHSTTGTARRSPTVMRQDQDT